MKLTETMLLRHGEAFRYVVADSTTGEYLGCFNSARDARRFAKAHAMRHVDAVVLMDWRRRRFETVRPGSG
ncbi:MAG TPA: hypothetical protein VFC99_16445 [Acidimicrobiia bacterium]|nr:hypothetical protein [Acidimicrobiia bacterium]